MQDTANSLRKRLEALQEPFKGYPRLRWPKCFKSPQNSSRRTLRRRTRASNTAGAGLGVESNAESDLSIEDGQFVHCTLGIEQSPQLGCIGWIGL